MSPRNSDDRLDTERRYDELYAKYGRRFEPEHVGEYLAISPRGKTVLAPTLAEVVHRAAEELGPGGFVYRVGELAAVRFR